jgi:hypothetical protein
MRPAQFLAGQCYLILAERGTMAVVRARLVRRTETDGRLAANQGWLVGYGPGRIDGLLDGVRIMAIDSSDNMPAI